jgi:hypothetical protein
LRPLQGWGEKGVAWCFHFLSSSFVGTPIFPLTARMRGRGRGRGTTFAELHHSAFSGKGATGHHRTEVQLRILYSSDNARGADLGHHAVYERAPVQCGLPTWMWIPPPVHSVVAGCSRCSIVFCILSELSPSYMDLVSLLYGGKDSDVSIIA